MSNEFQLQNFRCSITPLTPIYIGCGEAYTPADYVIDDGVLYSFDPANVPLTPGLFNKLLEASRSNDITAVPAFFATNKERYSAFSQHAVEVSPVVEKSYQLMVQNRNKANQNVILKSTARIRSDGVAEPYIPGSGIKGAIRTALVNRLVGDQKQSFGFEKRLFGKNFSDSPLRFLSVSDFLTQGNAKTRIEECRRREKDKEATVSIPQKFEFILQGQYRLFNGEIRLQKPHGELAIASEQLYTSVKEIVKDLNLFYLERFKEDAGHVLWQKSQINGSQWIREMRSVLAALAPEMEAGRVALIRIGGDIGAECLTLRNGSAQIKNIKAPKEPMKYSTTAWCASVGSDVLPFGWALIEIETQHENSILRAWCSKFERLGRTSEDLLKVVVAKKKSYLAELEEQLKALEQQEQARLLAEQAEKEKQEQLAQLSDNMREVAALVDEMSRQTSIKPGSDLYGKVFKLLERALQWPMQEQKDCAARLGPLMKKKDMYQGKRAKELKTTLAQLRQES